MGAEQPAIVDGSSYRDLSSWISDNHEWEDSLYKQGYVIFRGFPITDPPSFDAALDLLMRPSLEFSEETSPRSGVSGRVFTSTDYPQRYPIQFHHEFSYRQSHPDRLAFCCISPAKSGGATPIADARRVLSRIPAGLVERFEQSGIAYVRHFGDLGVSWKDAFGTSDKTEVSDYCAAHGISYSWSGEDLSTSQTAPAVIEHDVTGERAWFNSVVNLNVAGIEPKSIRDALMALPPELISTNTTYGTGEAIDPETIAQLRQIYEEAAIRFEWQTGDLLLIDNVLTAHARDPFEGDRRVIVGMGNSFTTQH
jgi:alpha-ketoglutarate-dependent taurine dioxygenase